MLRATVDTNVWVSATINPLGFPGRVLTAYVQQRFMLVTSEPLLEEFAEVLQRSRIARRMRITNDERDELLALMTATAEIVELTGIEPICRDPDDDRLIETAIRGGAAYIVTRDDDLKFADEVHAYLAGYGIQALSVARFLDMLESNEPTG